MGRRAKSKKLSGIETARLLEAATALHRACCDPLLNVSSDDYRALRDLHQAMCETIRKLGHDLPWVSYASRMHGGQDD